MISKILSKLGTISEDEKELEKVEKTLDSNNDEKFEKYDLMIQVLVDEIKEIVSLNENVNKKINDMNDQVRRFKLQIDDLKKEFDDERKRKQQIDEKVNIFEANMEKFVSLYEAITNIYNPFAKKDDDEETSELKKENNPSQNSTQTITNNNNAQQNTQSQNNNQLQNNINNTQQNNNQLQNNINNTQLQNNNNNNAQQNTQSQNNNQLQNNNDLQTQKVVIEDSISGNTTSIVANNNSNEQNTQNLFPPGQGASSSQMSKRELFYLKYSSPEKINDIKISFPELKLDDEIIKDAVHSFHENNSNIPPFHASDGTEIKDLKHFLKLLNVSVFTKKHLADGRNDFYDWLKPNNSHIAEKINTNDIEKIKNEIKKEIIIEDYLQKQEET